MISCTEFIPAYSELFTFLEEKHGREEVDRFWKYLFEPDGKGIPLINFVRERGIRGCWDYWAGTLNEEAADFTMYLNEKAGWYMNVMHRCPSKGRLLELEKRIGIKPYHDYCLHCDSYRAAAEKVGLKYIYNFSGVDHAACSMLIYDPKVFDGRIIIDENTEIMDRRASQNAYFHRDFHSSLNMGLDYLGEKYGEAELIEYLRAYTAHVYGKLPEAIKRGGLGELKAHIEKTYVQEHAPDAVKTLLAGNALRVEIDYCPGVRHLRETGRRVSRWYAHSTSAVMQAIADASGLRFEMGDYDPQTGRTSYAFFA
ncbi:MAG: hypothetical protein IJH38_03310 [Clostridia bacterium]|nr:hypothetical protein [Clostridia bacterium]